MAGRSFSRARATLEAIVVALIVTLLSAPGAWAAGTFKRLHKFTNGKDGGNPYGGLIFDAAGYLYGTSHGGGAHKNGTVFMLTPNDDGSWTESVIHSFDPKVKDGYQPFGGLIFDQNGNLYGTTFKGGAYGAGTVFELTPNGDGTWTESLLHSFSGPDGGLPEAGLIFDSEGNLYGTTSADGDSYSSGGTVFEMTPNGDGTWTESVLHFFHIDGKDGFAPLSSLIFDSAGNLYGTTNRGGAYGYGTVFQLTPNGDGTWTENLLHSFKSTGAGGFAPVGGPIFDPNGNLYGTASQGGAHRYGTIFELVSSGHGSWKYSLIHTFHGKDGRYPAGTLIFDPAGNLDGTTYEGGGHGHGAVFQLTPNGDGTWTENVLRSFTSQLGPVGGSVVFDAHGSLYGTCNGDAADSWWGSAFEITP